MTLTLCVRHSIRQLILILQEWCAVAGTAESITKGTAHGASGISYLNARTVRTSYDSMNIWNSALAIVIN
jgi:hypothetical protein